MNHLRAQVTNSLAVVADGPIHLRFTDDSEAEWYPEDVHRWLTSALMGLDTLTESPAKPSVEADPATEKTMVDFITMEYPETFIVAVHQEVLSLERVHQLLTEFIIDAIKLRMKQDRGPSDLEQATSLSLEKESPTT